jgi:CheY-like chemotaxis protein
VELNGLVEQVVELTRARWCDMAQKRGVAIELQRELAWGLPSIMGAESEIREALTNLVFNAVDAMPSGGVLTVRTRLQSASQVALEVADSGCGMDEDTRRRCLEPFFTTKGERGTGMGLAMVYGTVRRHEADIAIDSAPGRGTTVRMIFSVPDRGSAATGAKILGERRPLRPLRLLIVDDDPLLIKSLRDTLIQGGHEIVTAASGRAGIDTFRAALEQAKPFDAVITDLGMPHVDGRQVATAIKSASHDTPVILLTGWGQRLIADGDTPPHVDQILSKPPTLRALLDALTRLAGHRGVTEITAVPADGSVFVIPAS